MNPRRFVFPLLGAGLLTLGACAVQSSQGTATNPAAQEPAKVEKSVYDTANTPEVEKPKDLFGDGKIRLVIRVDDIGFCHSANMAFKKIAEEGKVTAASVLVNTPWLDEAVELLKAHPEVSVGVHTCLNAEWVPYRWGPVSCASEVPSLVDEWGNFFGTRKALVDHNPDPDEAEKEIRAQIDLAIRKGLKLSYLDHHMGAAVTTPELKERFVKIAKDYNLPISRWCGEVQGPVVYSTDPAKKVNALVEGLRKLENPGTYLVVVHPGMDTPELSILKDLNANGLPNMSVHREAEANMLCSPRLREVLKEKNIELVGYGVFAEKFPGMWIDPQEE